MKIEKLQSADTQSMSASKRSCEQQVTFNSPSFYARSNALLYFTDDCLHTQLHSLCIDSRHRQKMVLPVVLLMALLMALQALLQVHGALKPPSVARSHVRSCAPLALTLAFNSR